MARTIFMGTPKFALPSLQALAEGSQLLAVVAQPDKPRGRGQALQAPPTAVWAHARQIPVLQPLRARDEGFLDALRALDLDLIVVAAYGKILPRALLDLPRLGCVNVHASLLPRYRGAAPIQWAIARGERESGVTLMQMDEGLDTGAMLARQSIPIAPEDTGGSLTQKLSVLGGELLAAQLAAVLAGWLAPTAQDGAQASLAPKLTRDDAWLDFALPAAVLHDRVRAFQPWPGALLRLTGGCVKVLRTEVVPGGAGLPGTVLKADHAGLVIGCSQGALRLLEVQPEGKRPMAAGAFVAGHKVVLGTAVG